jgi:hypothetical protein
MHCHRHRHRVGNVQRSMHVADQMDDPADSSESVDIFATAIGAVMRPPKLPVGKRGGVDQVPIDLDGCRKARLRVRNG